MQKYMKILVEKGCWVWFWCLLNQWVQPSPWSYWAVSFSISVAVEGTHSDGPKTSLVWKYFEKVAGKNQTACNICERAFSVKGSQSGTSSMKRHLANVHGIIDEKHLDKTPFDDDSFPTPRTQPQKVETRAPSLVWKYFAKVEGKEESSCSLCGKSLKTKGGTTCPLIRHLNALHDIVD